ncbi:sensor histidine kinase [Methylocapsa acidiphila]|uniref:sensor histidine kinase n=1 Tax=Methylocapsa acidiphila TaxID=133552 RepID=UPI0004285A50|nr:response regulator [Methylocapsa acidiphila]
MSAIRQLLYIEDDPGIVRLVEKFLDRQGFSVTHAGTLGEARRLISNKTSAFDVVALDHQLPDGAGLELLEVFAENPPKLPVVYVTASADTQVAVAALRAGASDYVPKDISGGFLELLVSALNGAIERAELERAKELAEREIREARDRAELLLQEVNHRVANSLALVAALVRIQGQSDPVVKSALEETQVRITAIADIHRCLSASQDVRQIEMNGYLSKLTSDLENAHCADGRSHRIRLEAEQVICPLDKAVSIGMIITELVTNAYKYAYREGEVGQIRVKLFRSGDPDASQIRLVVEDDGVGWRNHQLAQGTGFGTRIVNMMAASLNAVLRLEPVPNGTCAVVEFSHQPN